MVSIEEEIEVKYADMVSEVSPHLVSLSNAAFLIVWHAMQVYAFLKGH